MINWNSYTARQCQIQGRVWHCIFWDAEVRCKKTTRLQQLAALGKCQPSSVFYFSSPGPLSPTDAEVRLMAPASACYGNTSLALAYAAQGAGVVVAVIACDAISAVTESSIEQMCRASSALADAEKVRRKPFVVWPEGLSFVTPRYV